MQEHLFEYAVIRIVPRVEREEFCNAGIIVFCKKENILRTVVRFNKDKCTSLFPETDVNDIQHHLCAFEKIAHADPSGGPIAALDAPSRFRWLTAKRSTVIQTSPVHPGLSNNIYATIDHLLNQMIL